MYVISVTIPSLTKQMYKVLSVISATIATLLKNVFPALGAVARYTFRINIRDRLINLFKVREVLADEGNQKVQK
jgi:hypothetical protein